MEGMARATETTGTLQSDLIDLSGVYLDELGEVSGLPTALAALQDRLVHSSAPLCEADVSPGCRGGGLGRQPVSALTVDQA